MPGREVFGEEEIREVNEVLKRKVLFRYGFDAERDGIFKVREFEKEFAGYVNSGHALGVSSGSAALKVALEALNLPKGKEVLTQCFTFVATIEAIEEAGLKPVLCDIDETLNLSVEDASGKVTEDTVGILPVHMMGASADIEGITGLAESRGLKIVEDACQSTGASFRGKKAGTFGDIGCFSFDYVKVMTTGEGGMLVTDDEELYRQAEFYHDHGHPHLSHLGRGEERRARKGFNYRMNEIQGALGVAQIRKLDGVIEGQRRNKKIIKDALKDVPGLRFRKFHDEAGDIATFLVFSLPGREKAEGFKEMLRGMGVAPATLNYWHFDANIEIAGGGSFSRSRDILDRTVALEIRTIMPEEALRKIIEAVRESAGKIL